MRNSFRAQLAQLKTMIYQRLSLEHRIWLVLHFGWFKKQMRADVKNTLFASAYSDGFTAPSWITPELCRTVNYGPRPLKDVTWHIGADLARGHDFSKVKVIEFDYAEAERKALSRYARWIEAEQRFETGEEVVQRMIETGKEVILQMKGA